MCYVKTIEVLDWYDGKNEWGTAVAADALEIDLNVHTVQVHYGLQWSKWRVVTIVTPKIYLVEIP